MSNITGKLHNFNRLQALFLNFSSTEASKQALVNLSDALRQLYGLKKLKIDFSNIEVADALNSLSQAITLQTKLVSLNLKLA